MSIQQHDATTRRYLEPHKALPTETSEETLDSLLQLSVTVHMQSGERTHDQAALEKKEGKDRSIIHDNAPVTSEKMALAKFFSE